MIITLLSILSICLYKIYIYYIYTFMFWYSSANAKKWEIELQTLKNNNVRLTTALQESTANVEEWKKQLAMYKEESTRMKKRVKQKFTLCSMIVGCIYVFISRTGKTIHPQWTLIDMVSSRDINELAFEINLRITDVGH